MKILFVMRNAHYIRNYESVLTELCQRHHNVVVGLELGKTVPPELERFVARLARYNQGYMHVVVLPQRWSFWSGVARQVRALRDYCRYLLPLHKESRRCAERAKAVLNWPFRFMSLTPRRLRSATARVVGGMAAFAEQIIPASRSAKQTIRLYDPELVLVTPLIDIDSDQIDYVKACRTMRIPVGHCVASWDNLTNKGLIKALPDRVFVWNETQRREAAELHGIPPERVAMTGAQTFDRWFTHKVSRSRDQFCQQLGLDPARPILLYVASSVFICRNEIDFVLRWLGALRASADEPLRNASVIIRPHPKATKTIIQWDDQRLAPLDPVVIFPRGNHTPVSPTARNDYFDSLYHCAAVVGINTSAMLEAGIVGRRCFTILLDEVKEGQQGMVHFRYLTRDGFLGVANNLEEHLQQLSQEVGAGPSSTAEFVHTFLRPYGLDQASTPIFVAHVEDMEDLAVEGQSVTTKLGWMLRPLLLPLVLLDAVAALGNTVGRLIDQAWKSPGMHSLRRMVSRSGRLIARFVRHKAKYGRRQARRLTGALSRSYRLGHRAVLRGGRLTARFVRFIANDGGRRARRLTRATSRSYRLGSRSVRRNGRRTARFVRRAAKRPRNYAVRFGRSAVGYLLQRVGLPTPPQQASKAIAPPPVDSPPAEAQPVAEAIRRQVA